MRFFDLVLICLLTVTPLVGCGAPVAESPRPAEPVQMVAITKPVVTEGKSTSDWPQWMGPDRNDVWQETGIIDKFPEGGPPVVWRAKLGGGYGGPAVVGNRVYVMDYLRKGGELQNDPNNRNTLQGTERVLCLDAKDGNLIWKHEYDCPYAISYANGPRCTPTVDGNRVYALGAEGNLACLEAETGKVIWSKAFKVDYKAPTPIWGFTSHPLIDGDLVYCLVGGPGSTVVAFDKYNGKEVWKALSAPDAGYSSPTMIEAGGAKQLLVWHPESLNSLNPRTGEVYWTEPLVPQYGMSVSAPVKSGDLIYLSGIGDVGGVWKLRPDRPAVEEVWIGDNKSAVYTCNSTPFIENGMIFGADCRGGQLRGVELETGKRLWETFKPTTGERRASHGTAFITKHADRYFIFAETGHLIIAHLSREGYEEIDRAQIVKPTSEAFGREVVWVHPAFANKSVYVRNDEEIVCVSLAK